LEGSNGVNMPEENTERWPAEANAIIMHSASATNVNSTGNPVPYNQTEFTWKLLDDKREDNAISKQGEGYCFFVGAPMGHSTTGTATRPRRPEHRDAPAPVPPAPAHKDREYFRFIRLINKGVNALKTWHIHMRSFEIYGTQRPLSTATSTGRRNTSIKLLGRGFEPQSLARPFVDLTRHFIQVALGVHRQVGSLGKVLSE